MRKKPHGNHNILDGEHHGPTKHILNMPLFWGRDLIYLNVHLMCYLHKSLADDKLFQFFVGNIFDSLMHIQPYRHAPFKFFFSLSYFL